MKVSRKWIDWAHGPGAEDGQSLAMTLCDLASSPGTGAVCVTDPALIAELVESLSCTATRAWAMRSMTWGRGGSGNLAG